MGLIDPQTSDGRVIFFLPWQNSTMAGEFCEISFTAGESFIFWHNATMAGDPFFSGITQQWSASHSANVATTAGHTTANSRAADLSNESPS